jgi:hypothetical protein
MPVWLWLKTPKPVVAADAAEPPTAVPNAKKLRSTRRFIPNFLLLDYATDLATTRKQGANARSAFSVPAKWLRK